MVDTIIRTSIGRMITGFIVSLSLCNMLTGMFVVCRWISVLNNAKESVLMKAFGEATDKDSSPINQSVKELTHTIIQEVRRLPGNHVCCDCSAPGTK